MRSEPKTQQEILRGLGDLPDAAPVRFMDRWKTKTLDNRHVAILVLALTIVFFFGALIHSSRRSNSEFTGHHSHNDHAYHAVHFSRDRPLDVLILGDLPPVDNDEDAWSKLITAWDRRYGLVVVLSPDVRIQRIQRLDVLLKKLNRPQSDPSATATQQKATWFFAAQTFAETRGAPYYPASPRLMVTCSFHALVMGHEVEFISAISSDQPLLLKRLGEGQGEVNNRFVLLPPKDFAKPNFASSILLSRFAPFTLVSTNADASSVVTQRIVDSTKPLKQQVDTSSFDVSARRPCVVRPFDVSDYKWACREGGTETATLVQKLLG
jgi:hypothetical protein